MILCVLGRQPELGLAELERVYGSANVERVLNDIAFVNADVNINRLGGTVKTAEILFEHPSPTWRKVIAATSKHVFKIIDTMPETGKIKLGLSLHGFNEDLDEINKSGLMIKKAVKKTGRSARVVPNLAPTLSSAQTLHNQLTSELGLELLFVTHGDNTLVGRVTSSQNINDYTRRDRGRPRRDAKVGMLPPKLAQILVNLATGDLERSDTNLRVTPSGAAPKNVSDPEGGKFLGADLAAGPANTFVVLDPFCGTGVVLQEAALMGFSVYGTDISDRMVSYSKSNLDWLSTTYKIEVNARLEVDDAAAHTWQPPIDAVACEGYLGEPLITFPEAEKLKEIMHECNQIAEYSLKNMAKQLKTDTPVVIALPTWWDGHSFHHLKVIDEIEVIGYTWVDLKEVSAHDLVYHREDQVVGRKILVLKRK